MMDSKLERHLLILFMVFSLCIKHRLILCVEIENDEFCGAGQSCSSGVTVSKLPKYNNKYIFYDVNPAEGFNLRRDVYMRMAIFSHNLKKNKKYQDYLLVLPPFNNLYHWKSKDVGEQIQIPWNSFFDVKSLQIFAPVIEMYEVFEREKYIVFDRIYNLQNYPDPFENGIFKDKWEIQGDSDCLLMTNFWGYSNITYKTKECILFQGYTEMLKELIDLNPDDRMILFANGQIPLHDEYGSRKYWQSRISMKFNSDLIAVAENFIKNSMDCHKDKCENYISVHWRRGDFAAYRSKDVPSIEGTAKQIQTILKKHYGDKINSVFIATDSNEQDFLELINILIKLNINVEWFVPSAEIRSKFKDGGVAIIEQIICSHAAYFVGTHESTFSFRIQEEREILGFDSDATFNRLCPDSGECERPSRWQIVR